MNVHLRMYAEKESYFDNIPPVNIYNYAIWRNGQDGAIVDNNNDGVYRFVESRRNGVGEPIHYDFDINEIPTVAVGILAFWLKYRKNGNRLLEVFAKRLREVEDFKDLFTWYTELRFNQFKENNKKDPDSWDWDWNYEFYTRYIIPHEIHLNKESEALFDYITDDDISYAKSIMKNYIAYLKKTRSGLGYVVNKELLVLRAFNTGCEFQLEDLEDFEITTILDRLEENGYVQVAWIEGHGYEAVRLLDKGKVYLKELEERRDINDIESGQVPQTKVEAAISVFNDKLDERKICSELLKTDHLKLGPKQFAFATKDFFRKIGWLATDIDTHYVGWMKNNQIINCAANDLQHVQNNDNMDKLKENLKKTFQFENGKGKWEDNLEYYKRQDSKKINSGK